MISELVKDVPEIYQAFEFPTISLGDDTKTIGANERKRLGVSLEMQRDWSDASEAFDLWRWRIEQLGIIVFSFNMPTSDCRGFVLKDHDKVPTIVVNNQDSDQARIFTLLHEYTHILLRRFGICGYSTNVDEKDIEGYANSVAANILMPKDKVVELAEVCSVNKQSNFEAVMEAARSIANYFKVSVESTILRLQTLGQVPPFSHDEYTRRMQGKHHRKKRGRAPYYRRYLNRLGNKYVSVVLDALNHNYIDAAEADDILDGVKSSHFHMLEVDLAERQKKYGAVP